MPEQESNAKRAAAHDARDEAQREESSAAEGGRDRGPGASRGTRAPRGNKARAAARKAEEELDSSAADQDGKDEEDEEDAAAERDDVFWKHLVWGAYRSRKSRGE